MRIDEIKGQENVKRALTVAAVQKTEILVYGVSGIGKSSLCNAFNRTFGVTEFFAERMTTSSTEVTDFAKDNILNFTMCVEVSKVPYHVLTGSNTGDTDEEIENQVTEARNKLAKTKKETLRLNQNANAILKNAYERLELSPAIYRNILTVATSIWALDEKAETKELKAEHVAEAIQYCTNF